MHKEIVTSALLALTSIGAFAQTPAIETTPIPVAGKPDFSKMFLGDWHCSTQSSRLGRPLTWTQTTTVSPDGYWLVTVSTIPNSRLHATEKITYDSSTKRWVDIETDEQGGYGVSTSPGWHGNTMVWSDVLSHDSPVTITRVSATQRTADQAFVKPDGHVGAVKDVCTKN